MTWILSFVYIHLKQHEPGNRPTFVNSFVKLMNFYYSTEDDKIVKCIDVLKGVCKICLF